MTDRKHPERESHSCHGKKCFFCKIEDNIYHKIRRLILPQKQYNIPVKSGRYT
jgi:hypothetical protein